MVAFFMDHPVLGAFLVLAVLGGGMLGALEVGRRTGMRHLDPAEPGSRAGLGALEGSIYALFGLLLAFTFSGAADRFAARRARALDEAKAVGGVWKRLDFLPAESRSRLQDLVRRHVSENLKAHEESRSFEAFREAQARMGAIEDQTWAEAVRILQRPESQGYTMLVTGALGGLFEARANRAAAVETHPPVLIISMLIILAFVCAFLGGYGMAEAKRRKWLHVCAYIVIVSVTMYVILDLEFPRAGLIRADGGEAALRALLTSLK